MLQFRLPSCRRPISLFDYNMMRIFSNDDMANTTLMHNMVYSTCIIYSMLFDHLQHHHSPTWKWYTQIEIEFELVQSLNTTDKPKVSLSQQLNIEYCTNEIGTNSTNESVFTFWSLSEQKQFPINRIKHFQCEKLSFDWISCGAFHFAQINIHLTSEYILFNGLNDRND